jgi:hypothetical protein
MATKAGGNAVSAIKFGGRKGAATAPHQDVIGADGKVKAAKPGDANVKQMSAATWTPRHARRAR